MKKCKNDCFCPVNKKPEWNLELFSAERTAVKSFHHQSSLPLFSFWNHYPWLYCAHILSHISCSCLSPCFNNFCFQSTFMLTLRKRNIFVIRIRTAFRWQLCVNKACCRQSDSRRQWTIRVSAGDLQGDITWQELREALNLSGNLGSFTAFWVMICIMNHQGTLRESLRGQ